MTFSFSSQPSSGRTYPLIPAVLALALGSFAIGVTEFTIMGLLPQAVADLGVDLPSGGILISAYAIGVVVGAPVLAAALARVDRRLSAGLLMIIFALGHLGSIFAPDYTSMLVARFLSGLPHGAYFSAAALAASHLAGPARRGQAISWVLAGLSVAMLVGAPAATWLGQATNWRSMFIVVTVLASLTVLFVFLLVPRVPAPENASIRRELSGLRSAGLWKAIIVAVIGFAGVFALYTYIAEITVQVGGMPASLIPLVLALYGVGGVAGTLLGGKMANTRPVFTVIVMIAALTVSLALFGLTSPWWLVSCLFVLTAGGTASALSPAMQVILVDSAPQSPQLAGAFNHSAFNMANAMGAWIGAGVLQAGFGVQLTPLAGAAVAAVGLVLAVLLLGGRRIQRHSTRGHKLTGE
ncbi:MAG: MFS transporter [Micrococcaceae bacterium]